jgi:hypothetical protein
VTLEHTSRSQSAKLLNISANGALVETTARLYGGEKINVAVTIPGKRGKKIVLRSLVAWAKFASVTARDNFGLRFFAEAETMRNALSLIRELKSRGTVEKQETYVSNRIKRRLSSSPPVTPGAW